MRLIAFALLLATTVAGQQGSSSVPRGDYKFGYFLSDTPRNWFMAAKDCKQRGLRLGRMTATYEKEALLKAISGRMGDNFWFSLTDLGSTGTWYWDSHGAPILHVSDWAAGEPNYLGQEQCAEIKANSRQWNNADCRLQQKYVCEGYLANA